MTTFSVLICTCQRHELLQKALHSLLEATTEKPDQVVVVNGGEERAHVLAHHTWNRVVKRSLGLYR